MQKQISTETISFLLDLSENNTKEWFLEHKLRYELAKAEFETFVATLLGEIQKFDKTIPNTEAKKFIYRIYRDVRFSKDKSPYKQHFGAHIHFGTKQAEGSISGYYLHIEPNGKSMLAGGAYMPPSEWIKAIREEINMCSEEFHDIINSHEFATYFQLDGEKLKRPPLGYDATHKDIEYLKYKSIIAVHTLTDEQIISPNFMEHCVNVFRALHPFNSFLNRWQQ